MKSIDRSGRRSFIKLIGSVLGAGAGLAIAGTATASTAASTGTSTRDAGIDACAVYCYRTTTNCESCGTGRRWFRCVNNCDGSVSYNCFQRTCAGFCLSQSAC